MASSLTRSHVLILPLVALCVVLLEEIAEYYLRIHVAHVALRTLCIMLCYAVGFSIGGAFFGPRLKALMVRLRSTSRRGAGRMGVAIFFCGCYGALFYAFYLLESRGPVALMPWMQSVP